MCVTPGVRYQEGGVSNFLYASGLSSICYLTERRVQGGSRNLKSQLTFVTAECFVKLLGEHGIILGAVSLLTACSILRYHPSTNMTFYYCCCGYSILHECVTHTLGGFFWFESAGRKYNVFCVTNFACLRVELVKLHPPKHGLFIPWYMSVLMIVWQGRPEVL